MATTMTTEERVAQERRNELVRYLTYQNHRGKHMWRVIRSPVTGKGLVVACFKCGKYDDEWVERRKREGKEVY